MLGTLAEGRLALEEIHRFPNRILTVDGHLRWDLPHLEKEIFAGLALAGKRGVPISGISTDSWGVDYVLLDAEGEAPMAQPYCYRDSRNIESSDQMVKKLSFRRHAYAEDGHSVHGHQHAVINWRPSSTIMRRDSSKRPNHFLLIADYFNARFSGVEAVEESMASTTQVYNPARRKRLVRRNWRLPRSEFSKSIFPRIVPSGIGSGPRHRAEV